MAEEKEETDIGSIEFSKESASPMFEQNLNASPMFEQN